MSCAAYREYTYRPPLSTSDSVFPVTDPLNVVVPAHRHDEVDLTTGNRVRARYDTWVLVVTEVVASVTTKVEVSVHVLSADRTI